MARRNHILLVVRPDIDSEHGVTVFHVYDWRNLGFIKREYPHETVCLVNEITCHMCTQKVWPQNMLRRVAERFVNRPPIGGEVMLEDYSTP